MIKNTVINAELGYALATARHKDAIVICDANMPIPDGCNVIDVSLIRGVPTLEQTICAIMNDLVAERYEVFELMMLCIKRFSRCCRSCLAEPSVRIA